MADKAKELDVSNFRTQFKNYVRAQKGQNIVYGNVMEFSGTAIMWDTGEWIALDDGVYRLRTVQRKSDGVSTPDIYDNKIFKC